MADGNSTLPPIDGSSRLHSQEESREDSSTTGGRLDSSQTPSLQKQAPHSSSKDDITTEEGKQQASKGESPLSLYIREMGEMQMSAVEKLFSTAVDSPCASKIPKQKQPKVERTDSAASSSASERFLKKSKAAVAADAADDVCSPMSGCQQSIENQLDVLTNCRQPLEFFPFLSNVAHHTREEGGASGTVPLGMYTVPVLCEYCGEESTKFCGPKCQRPTFYFQKQKPPFAMKEHWDPVTEYEIPAKPLEPESQTKDGHESPSWVAGFFGSPKNKNRKEISMESS